MFVSGRSFLRLVVVGAIVAALMMDGSLGGASDRSGGIHQPAIDALEGEGILVGTECEQGRDCSGEPLPRWVMAVWLARAVDAAEPAPVDVSRFADVDAGAWWAAHVERIARLEITRGCTVDRYCPADSVTRGQMASFLTRAFELPRAPSRGFVDIAGNAHAAAIDALAAAGVTAGCASAPLRYCPDRPVTRGQMATFVARVLDLVPRPTAPHRPESERIAYNELEVDTIWVMNADGTNQVRLATDAQDPAWSPDGTRIVYTSQNYSGADIWHDEVWVMNADGTDRRRLTTDEGVDHDGANPRWSPDGTMIAYELNSGIAVVNADGTNQRQLTTDRGGNPRWSPDGTLIAYGSGSGIAVVNADGSDRRQITTDGGWYPRWSPDGTRIAYTSTARGTGGFVIGGRIAVVNADGSDRRQLTTDFGWDPEWSPDGTILAFTDEYAYRVMNADGTDQRDLVDFLSQRTISVEHALEWSPDGTRIVYSQTSDEIWAVDRDGTNRRQLAANGRLPDWSPDGTRIAYHRRIRGGWSSDGVWLMNADGSNRQRLTNVGRAPRWSPDGTRIAYSTSLGQVWVNEEGGFVRDLSNLSDEGDAGGVWVVRFDGTNQQRLSADRGDNPSWSPDGTRIAYELDDGIAVIDADGTKRQQLTTDHGSDPEWSPDGTRIAYELDDGIAVIDADGTKRQQLTTDHGSDPEWSPDGTRIAYSTGNGGLVYVIDTEGPATNGPLLYNKYGIGDVLSWSPDGTMIAYGTSRGVWVVDTGGTDHRRLTTRGEFPAWAP